MNTKAENSATCKGRLVTCLSRARNVRLADIHRQIVEVYDEGATKEGKVRKWCRLFKEGTTMRDRTPPPVHVHYFKQFKWKNLEHPPYCPHLAPSHCHWFIHLKKLLTD
jgi:hypothetical protein